MTRARGAKIVVVAVLLGAAFYMPQARALPLTQAACERYAAERATLARLGVRDHLQRGAQWARANLTQPQLDLIQRYIRIEEALKFRCPDEFAVRPVEARQEPRRLDVMPPAPVRKPGETPQTGVTRSQTPPPPAKGPKEQG